MSTQFITNQEKLLSDVINNILPSTQRLNMLVGYFYFSGFQEIYKNIADKEVRILIGLDIEKDILNKVKEFELIQTVNLSRSQVRDNFNKSFVQLFNDSDFFDTEEKQNSFRLFLEKIKNKTLEIRKTVHQNHAKLYIFENKPEHNQNGELLGTIITGSSNLTRPGLKGQGELNVIFHDNGNYEEALKIFNDLWDEKNSVEIVGKTTTDSFLTEVIEKIWIDKLYDPYLLYIRVLEEYFSFTKKEGIILPSEITKNKFMNLKYQNDAIAQSIEILNRHSGVIIADVVGLGKSIIASAVAHNMGLRTIIITPPHLTGQWDDYHTDFGFNAKIFSSGKIQDAVEYDLSYNEPKLIIIDEAHKYRNELNIDYGYLHQLCQGNKVVLLTATPFNNQPQDIFSMIRLFQIPARSTIQTVDNLSYRFKELIKEYKEIKKSQIQKKSDMKDEIKVLAQKIRDILAPLVIRRSRLDLEKINEYRDDLKKQGISFPKVNDPEILDYPLGKLSVLYEKTLEKIASTENETRGFLGARYKPTNYLKDEYKKQVAEELGVEENLLLQSQANLAKFMRRLLVRRFESSVKAFHDSLNSLIKSSEYMRDWYNKFDKVPIYKKGDLPDIEDLEQSTEEDLSEELQPVTFDEQLKKYYDKGLKIIKKSWLKDTFIGDIEKDIKLLKEIRTEWFKDGIKHDPKLECFEKRIKQQLKKEPDRKIVIFTEFADTANYLNDKLKNKLKIFKYTSADSSYTNKKTIKENFDAGNPIQKDDYDILIATDAISEGFNLHRAGTVFNYDIPYNPTRVIQRVGRINRINKKVFDELFIYNFFPTATGEEEIRIKKISTLKISLFNALLGTDIKVLTSDEELESYYKDKFIKSMANQEELSWDVQYRNELGILKVKHPDVLQKAMTVPRRARIRRTEKKDTAGVIVFARKGKEYTFKLGISKEDYKTLGPETALKLFESEVTEKSEQVSKNFESVYQYLKNNLFNKKTQVPFDKGKNEAINKLDILQEKIPDKKDYFNDLKYVIKELDALPERYAKQIRQISEKSLEKDVEELQKDVSQKYLIDIIEKARRIEDEEESLILAEELI
ncbi:MAG: helicase-related protein [Elusimicrobiota bacterium]